MPLVFLFVENSLVFSVCLWICVFKVCLESGHSSASESTCATFQTGGTSFRFGLMAIPRRCTSTFFLASVGESERIRLRKDHLPRERRLLFKLIWKAAFVWVTPYLVQLTFSLEACSWKNGDLVFQRWSFFSILETCMGIDDPYVKKPRWRRNWNSISKMIKDGLAEGMDGHQEPRFRPRFFQGIMNRNVPTRLESTCHMARLESTKRAKLKTCKAAPTPTVSKVQITDMLLLTTSFLGYPLPRSHRHGGFEKKNVSIHKLFLSFPNKGGCSRVENSQISKWH